MRIQQLFISLLLSASLFALPVQAEQFKTFDNYTVHYIALNSQALNPEIAKSYQIKRSNNRALLNISVLEKQTGTDVNPVKAVVTATATNLTSQLRTLDIRELEDAGAIYYIAEVPIHNAETLTFKINIKPLDSKTSYDLVFNQQFFTE